MVDDYTLGALFGLSFLALACWFLGVMLATIWSQRPWKFGPNSYGPASGSRWGVIGWLFFSAPVAFVELLVLADAIGAYQPGSPVATRAAEVVQLLVIVGFAIYLIRWIRRGNSS